MSKFSAPLTVTKVGGRIWRIEKPFTFFSSKYEPVTVPKGLEVDFASIPRIFWFILTPDGQYAQAAALHDHLYKSRKDLTYKGPKRSRKECDDLFLEAMKDLGVNWFTRHTMHKAVRSFGWAH